MQKFKSDIVFTLNGNFLKNGIVVTDDFGKILDIKSSDIIGFEPDVEYFSGAICPGFINAHCHIELSFAKGKIEKGHGINHFINSLELLKKQTTEIEQLNSIAAAEQEMSRNGIMAVGDICNTAKTKDTKQKSSLLFYNFIEVFGSLEDRAETNFNKGTEVFNKLSEPKSIVPHAPYSVSLSLFEKIKNFEFNKSKVISIHHLESQAEIDFFKTASGEIVERLGNWQIPLPAFIPSHESPFEFIKRFLNDDSVILLVHNTLMDDEEIKKIIEIHPQSCFVLCPLSNKYIENKIPNYSIFEKFADKVCIGTDSLASNDQLSILEEIKEIQQQYPQIETETLLLWACKNASTYLDFKDLGTIETGKTPGLLHLKNFNIQTGKLDKTIEVYRII